jgi:hypothetical protein
MTEEPVIAAQGDHEYVITWHDGDETIESWLRVTPGLLEQFDVRAEEERVVRETAVFLAQRQEVADMPAVIELEDVAASYEDYLPDLAHRSRSPEEAQG